MVEVRERAQERTTPRCPDTKDIEDMPGADTGQRYSGPVNMHLTAHVEMVHRLAAPLGGKGMLIVAAFGQDPATGAELPPKIAHFQIGNVRGMVTTITKLAQDRHRNVYVPLAVMRADLPTGKKGFEGDIVGVLGLVADFDDDNAADYARRLPVTAPYALETSPGRFQAFLPLDRPVSLADAKPVAQALKEFSRCDHGTADMSHVWRVPGTLNWPNKRKVEGGRDTKPQAVTVVEPWDSSVISLEEIRKVLPERQRTTEKIKDHFEQPADPHDLPRGLIDRMTMAPPKGQRSENAAFVIRALVERGWSDDSIVAEIQRYPNGVGERYDGKEKVLRAEVERLRPKAKGDRNDHPSGRAKARGDRKGTGPREQAAGRPDNPPSEPPTAIEVNEDAIALEFANRHADQLRYCHDWGMWLHWDGARWQRERRRLAFHFAREVAREANWEGKAGPAKANTAAGVERFAQADPRLATISDEWDTDPWKLGTPGGTVNLRTGEMAPARPADHITKVTAVAPADPLHGGDCPTWMRFLEEATKGDKELIRFLRQMAGYCLTGDVSEECLFFVYGPGGNGKGVFLQTVGNILGDYATSAAMDTFTASNGDKHPTDLAKLRGARMVTASETEEGRAWAESRIKELTGNERPISARFMRQDFFEYWPNFKLVFVGNHQPVLKNVDDAARRRFNIIPFIHQPDNPDKDLKDKLRAEYPAILRWMIDGCLDWHRNGLKRPKVVIDATAEYFSEQDSLGRWIEEACDTGKPIMQARHKTLFASWSAWAAANGEEVGSGKALTAALQKRGYKQSHDRNGSFFRGIELRPIDTSNQYQNRMERDL